MAPIRAQKDVRARRKKPKLASKPHATRRGYHFPSTLIRQFTELKKQYAC